MSEMKRYLLSVVMCVIIYVITKSLVNYIPNYAVIIAWTGGVIATFINGLILDTYKE